MTRESRNFLPLHRWCPIVKNNLRTGPLGKTNKAQKAKKLKLYLFMDKEKEAKVTEVPAISPWSCVSGSYLLSFYYIILFIAASWLLTLVTLQIMGSGIPLQKVGCVSMSSQSGCICKID